MHQYKCSVVIASPARRGEAISQRASRRIFDTQRLLRRFAPRNDVRGYFGRKDENTWARGHTGARARAGFTLLELLIVISIIAILAAAIVPNFVGFDAEARVATTQTNLNTLRTRITLFRAKQGRNPKSLDELLTVTYDDMGAQLPYLEEMPAELISSKSGNTTTETREFKQGLINDGGWTYFKDRRKVVVDVTDELDSSWGAYEEEIPSKW